MPALMTPAALLAYAALLGPGAVAPGHCTPIAPPAALSKLISGSPTGREALRMQSLEELLERARDSRQDLRADFAPEIPGLLDRLAGGLAEDREREQEVPLERLAEMGGAGGELLAGALESPLDDDAEQRARAEAALHALIVLQPPAAVPVLEANARRTIGRSRERVLRALVACAVPERAATYLRTFYAEATSNQARSAALGALGHVDHPIVLEVLGTALAGDEPRLRRDAVRAAATGRIAAFANTARETLADAALGKELIEPLLEYFVAVPEQFEQDDFARLTVHLYGTGAVASDVGVRVIDAAAGLPLELDAIEPSLGPLLGRGGDLGLAAQILLARSGSREAQKALEKKFDTAVRKARDGDPRPLIERADLYLRLGDYSDAVKDYKQALDLAKESSILHQNTCHLGLARAFAVERKFTRALRELEDAGASPRKLVELSEEPYFAEMLAHSRYGDVFREARQVEDN